MEKFINGLKKAGFRNITSEALLKRDFSKKEIEAALKFGLIKNAHCDKIIAEHPQVKGFYIF